MTANTDVHTCSYYCERPGCVRRQRDELRDRMESALEAARGVVDGCHCATCTCNPGMTPAIRFDTSPAAQEGAVRDHLIALGWTPPGAQQPAAVDEAMVARFLNAFRNTPGDEAIGADEKVARRWLTAAIAAQQQGGAE